MIFSLWLIRCWSRTTFEVLYKEGAWRYSSARGRRGGGQVMRGDLLGVLTAWNKINSSVFVGYYYTKEGEVFVFSSLFVQSAPWFLSVPFAALVRAIYSLARFFVFCYCFLFFFWLFSSSLFRVFWRCGTHMHRDDGVVPTIVTAVLCTRFFFLFFCCDPVAPERLTVCTRSLGWFLSLVWKRFSYNMRDISHPQYLMSLKY